MNLLSVQGVSEQGQRVQRMGGRAAALCLLIVGLGLPLGLLAQDDPPGGTTPARQLRGTVAAGQDSVGINQTGLLYSQLGNAAGFGITSQDFTDTPTDNLTDSQAADDFEVTPGQIWTIDRLFMPGSYELGSQTVPSSIDVEFYANNGTVPGALLCNAANSTYTQDANEDFTVTLSTPCQLGAGRYWVSAQVNMSSTPGAIGGAPSQWYWDVSTAQLFSRAVWRNPLDGFGTGCTTFAELSGCFMDPLAIDMLFQLFGSTSSSATPTPTVTLTPTTPITATPTTAASATSTATPTVTATLPPVLMGGDRIGLYSSADAIWVLRTQLNTLVRQASEIAVVFGGVAGAIPLAGDWNNDDTDTVGMYVPDQAFWFMRNSNTPGDADIVALFGGIPGALPIVGDWDGDGDDSIGLYSPATGLWMLRNDNSTGEPDIVFVYGGIPGALPVVGDWDGDGIDTIGLYNSANALWMLRNSNSTGDPDVVLLFGGGPPTAPVTGDWDANGTDTVGIYNATNGAWFMRLTNTTGVDEIFTLFTLSPGAVPITGDWDGPTNMITAPALNIPTLAPADASGGLAPATVVPPAGDVAPAPGELPDALGLGG
ncbi:MAG: hypothetical protein GYB67_07855 [Chloroflexi bacterium]|nr:hypothetical protein [Chloroflexota bacterium]